MQENNPESRKQMAGAIKRARGLERLRESGPAYKMERSATEYIAELQGLKYFFKYVRRCPIQKVLDLGAGNPRGISELSKTTYGKGIEFEALGLTKPKEFYGFPEKKFHIGAAESLKSISDESFSGIVAVHSAPSYSAAPELVAKQIHRILIPGGVIKTILPIYAESCGDEKNDAMEKAYGAFFNSLRHLEFDVDTQKDLIGVRDAVISVVLGIKKGEQNFAPGTAKKLRMEDYFDMYNQISQINAEIKNV